MQGLLSLLSLLLPLGLGLCPLLVLALSIPQAPYGGGGMGWMMMLRLEANGPALKPPIASIISIIEVTISNPSSQSYEPHNVRSGT